MRRKAMLLLVPWFGLTAAMAAQGKAPLSPPEMVAISVGGKTISIQYSAPSVRGRKIFGPRGLLSHDATYPVWRAGANAATALHTEADLKLGDLNVPAGNYTLFVLVSDPDHWVLIVNKQTGQWGLTYHANQDLGRVPMQMSVPAQRIEQLRYVLTPDKLTLEWDNHVASVALTLQNDWRGTPRGFAARPAYARPAGGPLAPQPAGAGLTATFAHCDVRPLLAGGGELRRSPPSELRPPRNP